MGRGSSTKPKRAQALVEHLEIPPAGTLEKHPTLLYSLPRDETLSREKLHRRIDNHLGNFPPASESLPQHREDIANDIFGRVSKLPVA